MLFHFSFKALFGSETGNKSVNLKQSLSDSMIIFNKNNTKAQIPSQ